MTIPPIAAESLDLITTSVFKLFSVSTGGSPTALLTLTPICIFIFSLGSDCGFTLIEKFELAVLVE